MENCSTSSGTRSILMRKLLTICPVCKKMIFGRDIDVTQLEKGQWPIPYLYKHDHEDFPAHTIKMFIDSGFSVRHLEIINRI